MTTPPSSPAALQLREAGHLPDGRAVHEFTLSRDGLVVRGLTFGAIITAVLVPDRAGRVANIVRAFDRLDDYVGKHPYVGAILGRVANRIAAGRFEVDGRACQASLNEGPNTLHGGVCGWDHRLWTIERSDATLPSVTLSYSSPDGEEGFPGRVDVRTTFTLLAGGQWCVDVEATTDQPTPLNVSRHEYFNLAGGGTVLGHRLMIPGSRFHPTDALQIPTGTESVEGTPFDLRSPQTLGERIDDPHPQMVAAVGGYDQHWILDEPVTASTPRLAAELVDPASGRRMRILSTAPGIQFYTGNKLDGSLRSNGGEPMARYSAVCLEPQASPDSVHHADWPDTVLRPGQVLRIRTIHAFDVVD